MGSVCSGVPDLKQTPGAELREGGPDASVLPKLLGVSFSSLVLSDQSRQADLSPRTLAGCPEHTGWARGSFAHMVPLFSCRAMAPHVGPPFCS